MQKYRVYDIKKLENTTIFSLRDRGQPQPEGVILLTFRFFPCVTGVNLNICVLVSLRHVIVLSLRDRGQPPGRAVIFDDH